MCPHCIGFVSGWLVVLSLGVSASAQTPPQDIDELEAQVREAWATALIGSFTIATTYYVSSADGHCSYDGTASTFISGTKGPWANLNCGAARTALANSPTNGRIVYVRAGTYNLMDGSGTYGTSGLAVVGGGSAASPLILAAYPGDAQPVITGNECYSQAQIHEIATMGTLGGAPFAIRVRQTINIDGRYVRIEGLDLRCGYRHVVQASAAHWSLRNNVLHNAYEDVIKVLATSAHAYIGENECRNISSSCVDWFRADDGLITLNRMHTAIPDPLTEVPVAVGIGLKGGAARVVISRNRVERLSSDGTHAAFSIGGAPSGIDEAGVPSARDIYVVGNVIDGFFGMACQFVGGVDSAFNDNVVTRTLGFCRIGTDPEVRDSDPRYETQPLTARVRLRRNEITYAPVDCSAPVAAGDACYGIVVANPAEAVGLLGDANIYYSTDLKSPSFAWGLGGGTISWTDFKTSSGTDTTSTIRSASGGLAQPTGVRVVVSQ